MSKAADRSNMRISIHILLTVMLLTAFPGCFYTDSDVYFVEPLAGDPPLISVSTNLDTLSDPQVSDSLYVEYITEISGGELYYMYAGLAGSVIFESDSILGSFWITTSMADSAGVDTLYLQFYYSSNSNSLADKLGYEALIKGLKYPIDFMEGGAK